MTRLPLLLGCDKITSSYTLVAGVWQDNFISYLCCWGVTRLLHLIPLLLGCDNITSLRCHRYPKEITSMRCHRYPKEIMSLRCHRYPKEITSIRCHRYLNHCWDVLRLLHWISVRWTDWGCSSWLWCLCWDVTECTQSEQCEDGLDSQMT